MNVKSITIAIFIATLCGVGIGSCQTQSEKDLAAQIEIAKRFPQLNVNVQNGIATLNGISGPKETMDSVQKAILTIKGIHSVVDNTGIVQENNP